MVDCEEHDWDYEIDVSLYIMIRRQCDICDEEQETLFGLDDNDFQKVVKKS